MCGCFAWCATKIYIGSLLLKIFLYDLFLFLHEIPVANYVDKNTPYCPGGKILNFVIKLENAAEAL